MRTTCLAALGFAVVLLLALAGMPVAVAQELEPRSYSASPIGTNFALVTASNSEGDVFVDPALPVTDVKASVDITSLGFSHAFALGRHAASWAVSTSYLEAYISAAVYGRAQTGSRFGFADTRVRFTMNLIGPALTPRQFAHHKPSDTAGVSLSIAIPNGTYDPTRQINAGSNRWAFKPEAGFEHLMGKWFVDGSAGVWLFGNNTNYLNGNVLRQDPLRIFQVHGGYSFRTGQWLAAELNYYSGGATRVGRAPPANPLTNSRYGVAFSQPIGSNWSAKVSWSHWLSGKYGQAFSTTSVTLQYRWLDRANRATSSQ